MDFPKKLKTYRQMLNLTQEEVAFFLGINRSAYTCYETGKSFPTTETIRHLAKLFSVPIEHLAEPPKPKPTPPPPPPTTKISPFIELVLSDIAPMPPKRKKKKEVENISEDFCQLQPDEKELIVRLRMIKDCADDQSKQEMAQKLLKLLNNIDPEHF